jgi:hypothetical protein
MRLSLKQRIELLLRGQRIDTIANALKIADANNLDISFRNLSCHQLAGGDVEAVVAAMALAKKNNISLAWTEASAIDLAGAATGKHLVRIIEECISRHEYSFDTFSPDDKEPLVGFTRDGTPIKVKCTLRYRLKPQHVFGQTIENYQEPIAVKVAIIVNKAQSFSDLQMQKSKYEQTLLSFAAKSGVEQVNLNFEKV